VDALHAVFESVARYFSVLGEPTRLRILHNLCQEEKCVTDILKSTGLAQANASRHLGLMYQSGLLSRRREGNQIFYKVADPSYVELCRAVSLQIALRSRGAGPGFELVQPRPAPFHPAIPASPANHKEKESV
jgi:DNA-binding transcriptional ArsR family regulator